MKDNPFLCRLQAMPKLGRIPADGNLISAPPSEALNARLDRADWFDASNLPMLGIFGSIAKVGLRDTSRLLPAGAVSLA